MGYHLNQSVWRRGWSDTKSKWTSWQFYILDAVVAVVIGAVFEWYWGLAVVLFGMFCVWLVATASAPVKQRNEARKRVAELEEEQTPKIDAVPITGERSSYENNKNTAWAELKITNTSPSVSLESVSVQIVKLAQVFEEQDDKGVYHLHEPQPPWSPSNVYWSERNTQPGQLTLAISPNESKCALIAFHGDNSPALGFLNTPTYPVMLESRIEIEVSSRDSAIWRGTYYIEYHPSARDEFEFVEWAIWTKDKSIIPLGSDK